LPGRRSFAQGRPPLWPAAHRQGLLRERFGPRQNDGNPMQTAATGVQQPVSSPPSPPDKCDTSPSFPALGWCWFYIFLGPCLVLHPASDPRSDGRGRAGVNNLPWPCSRARLIRHAGLERAVFSALVKFFAAQAVHFRCPNRFLFAFSILVFGAALHWATPEQVIWIGRFLLYSGSRCSIFSSSSIFWSMVVDIFNSDQGQAAVWIHRGRRNPRCDLSGRA